MWLNRMIIEPLFIPRHLAVNIPFQTQTLHPIANKTALSVMVGSFLSVVTTTSIGF
jgi:hypothetical protein